MLQFSFSLIVELDSLSSKLRIIVREFIPLPLAVGRSAKYRIYWEAPILKAEKVNKRPSSNKRPPTSLTMRLKLNKLKD